jgi:hypothetical protein
VECGEAAAPKAAAYVAASRQVSAARRASDPQARAAVRAHPRAGERGCARPKERDGAAGAGAPVSYFVAFARFAATKSQSTRWLRKVSMNFGRRLR